MFLTHLAPQNNTVNPEIFVIEIFHVNVRRYADIRMFYDHDLAYYLSLQVSVLLSSALSKTDLNGYSLDHRSTRDLLHKSAYC